MNTIGSYSCICADGYEMQNGQCEGQHVKSLSKFRYVYFNNCR